MQRTIELTDTALEVIKGLKSSPKQISSKFFYDSEGSRIFQQIMRLFFRDAGSGRHPCLQSGIGDFSFHAHLPSHSPGA